MKLASGSGEAEDLGWGLDDKRRHQAEHWKVAGDHSLLPYGSLQVTLVS